MGLEFIEWLDNTIDSAFENIADCTRTAGWWMLIIVMSPIWFIPFLFWYFAIWKKGEEENGNDN